MIDLMDQPIVERFLDAQVQRQNIPPLRDEGRRRLLDEFGAAISAIRRDYHTPAATFATVLDRIPVDRGDGKWKGWGKVIVTGRALENHWCKLLDAFGGKAIDTPTVPTETNATGQRIIPLRDGTAYIIRSQKEIEAETQLRFWGKMLVNHPEAEWDDHLAKMNVPTSRWADAKAMAPEMPTTAEANAFFARIFAIVAAAADSGKVAPVTKLELAMEEKYAGTVPF